MEQLRPTVPTAVLQRKGIRICAKMLTEKIVGKGLHTITLLVHDIRSTTRACIIFRVAIGCRVALDGHVLRHFVRDIVSDAERKASLRNWRRMVSLDLAWIEVRDRKPLLLQLRPCESFET